MWVVLLLSFLTGFAVMQVELVAPRLVAPALGSTHLTWSVVFAVFLGALALGNALGGVLADRGRKRVVVGMFVAASGLIALVIPLAHWLAQGMLDGLPHGLRTFVAVLVLFGPAAFALGLIAPALARAALAASRRPGLALGAVAAAGASGSMAGTLTTGLWLLGAYDLRTVVWLAAALVGAGILLAGGLTTAGARASADETGRMPARWLWLAALAGAVLLTVEVAAGRLAARRLGTSLYTWTSIIGTVLGGLALGNAWGGRLAERADRTKTLGTLFLVASLAVAACLWTPRLISVIAAPSSPVPWPVLVFTACAAAFALPAIALGTLSPVILRAALADPTSDGRVAGRIYAAGTVGAVLGSLLAGYVLLPVLGSPLLIVSLAVLLALVSCRLQRRIDVAWLATLVVIGVLIAAPIDGVASVGRAMGLRPAEDVHVEESRYFHIAVSPHADRWADVRSEALVRARLPLPSLHGRLRYDERRARLHWIGPMTAMERRQIAEIVGAENAEVSQRLFERAQTTMYRLELDGFVHGYADLNAADWLEYDYEALYWELVKAFRGTNRPLSCFFIGGGCYTFQRHLLRHHHPENRITSAELDPAVTRVAHDLLGLPRDSRHTIHHDDARTVLRADASRYDLIFGDAFHDLAVPWHLTTREFAASVRAHLAPDGAYLVNLIDAFSSGRFLRAFIDTLGEVFPHVRVLSMAPRNDDEQQTFIVVASNEPMPWDRLRDGSAAVVYYDEGDLAALRKRTDPLILRDHFAPVEHLLAPVVRRRGAIERSR